MLERRTFLTVLTAGLATAATPGTLLAACHEFLASGPSVPRRDDFKRLVGRRFQLIDSEGLTSDATLLAFEDGPRCPRLEQFSFVLDTEGLEEGIYEIRHPEMGAISVNLMTSAHPSNAGQCHRVYVSRFV